MACKFPCDWEFLDLKSDKTEGRDLLMKFLVTTANLKVSKNFRAEHCGALPREVEGVSHVYTWRDQVDGQASRQQAMSCATQVYDEDFWRSNRRNLVQGLTY